MRSAVGVELGEDHPEERCLAATTPPASAGLSWSTAAWGDERLIIVTVPSGRVAIALRRGASGLAVSCRDAGKHGTKKRQWIHFSYRSESTAG